MFYYVIEYLSQYKPIWAHTPVVYRQETCVPMVIMTMNSFECSNAVVVSFWSRNKVGNSETLIQFLAT